MLNFRKAQEAASEIRKLHLGNNPAKDPVAWDLALALEAMVVELNARLSQIERGQEEILQQLRRLK